MAARTHEGNRAQAQHVSHCVVLGGGYAGVLAAIRLAGKARRRRLPIKVTLVNASPHFVERVRLHEVAAGRQHAPLSIAKSLEGTGVALRVGWVRHVDAAAKRLEIAHAGGEQSQLSYDALLFAPGSVAAPSRVAGSDEHAFNPANAEGAERLRQRLSAARSGERVVVVGGGLTALEIATEIAEARPELSVSLATRGEFGGDLSPRGRAYLQKTFEELRIDVHARVSAREVLADRLVLAPEASSAPLTSLPADIVILATGFRPSALAEISGLEICPDGRLVVDDTLRSPAHPAIWGAGDAVAVVGEDGSFLRMSCATAMPQGVHAADAMIATLAGEPAPQFGFSYVVRCMSLGRRRGLIQVVDRHDRPQDRVFTGGFAAWIKEQVCAYTLLSLRAERALSGVYRWPGQQRASSASAPSVGRGKRGVGGLDAVAVR
ncbi:NAD(P)/FAD-dependent oxidoreductase [Chondromyces crocatus]|uniref:Oxidoreductase n=1 Tax=Chondromyces crocatus TaxID=52 RepID=A0A0K1EHJ2_CHOCO|nr:FAD-dependent oxidoreductase [Chondromyces crocatus]AKT40324.1 oxidoreductase [Chondromyces crocatus]